MTATVRKERRKKARQVVRWPITVEVEHGTVDGETRNISFDGIYIRCDEPLKVDQDFRMAILTPERQAIALTGKIVWADLYALDRDENAFGMGVCFVEIAEKDRQAFEDVLTSRVCH